MTVNLNDALNIASTPGVNRGGGAQASEEVQRRQETERASQAVAGGEDSVELSQAGQALSQALEADNDQNENGGEEAGAQLAGNPGDGVDAANVNLRAEEAAAEARVDAREERSDRVEAREAGSEDDRVRRPGTPDDSAAQTEAGVSRGLNQLV